MYMYIHPLPSAEIPIMRVVPPNNKSRQVMGKNAYAHIFGTSAIRQGNDVTMLDPL